MKNWFFLLWVTVFSLCLRLDTAQAQGLLESVEHGFVQNGDVRLHYVTVGQGPLLIMLHGYPDFWYGWRYQIEEFAQDFRVVVPDLRGYNRSDKPEGVEAYLTSRLVSDVAAVIRHFGEDQTILMGTDWGGFIAWHVAMERPELVERLIIINRSHPRGHERELTHNPEQRENSRYSRNFLEEDSHLRLSPERLARRHADDPALRERYEEAFERSSLEAMMNYYRANYPRPPYSEDTSPVIKVMCPVLIIHGLEDTAHVPATLNSTWAWLESDLTMVTVPEAGHRSHIDRPDFVNRAIRAWLFR